MKKPISDHLIFFIHGIGQQYEKYGRLEHHVSTMQKNTEQILQQQFPNHSLRIQYVAIEWHSIVHELVDMKMDQITLETVPKVRLATNHWLMDCLYYFSKPYGQSIINTVCQQFNNAYNQHIKTYPDFLDNRGQCHIVGFSLGGVIAYDIASKQWKPEDGLEPQMTSSDNNPYLCYEPYHIQVPTLDFPLKYLFTCGSPIGAGLVFRGLDYMYYRPPPRTKVYNIFHPFDPLGYRMEPMINRHYSSIHPVRLSRAQRQPILPKIPNLGIRPSLANAGSLITKARRTFWHYVAANGNEEEKEEDINPTNTINHHYEENGISNSTLQSTSTTISPSHTSLGLACITTNSAAIPVVSTFSATMKHSRFKLSPLLTSIMEIQSSSLSINLNQNELNYSTTSTETETAVNLLAQEENILTHVNLENGEEEKNTEKMNNNDNEDEDDDDALSFITASIFENEMYSDNDTEIMFDDDLPTLDSCGSSNLSDSIHSGDSKIGDDISNTHYNQHKTILAMDGTMHPRLDYVLTENVIDTYANEWIVALKSHFKYWANRY
ncbi:unnamed protein product [Cunninghamella blakesleeana]